MSTPNKNKITELYPETQVRAEIAWIEKEMEKVRVEMMRRPSKVRHLRDLERQKQDRVSIIERYKLKNST